MSESTPDQQSILPGGDNTASSAMLLSKLEEADRGIKSLQHRRENAGSITKGAALIAGGLPIANSAFGVVGATLLGPIGLLVAGSAALAGASFLRTESIENKIREYSIKLGSIKSALIHDKVDDAEAISQLNDLIAELASQ